MKLNAKQLTLILTTALMQIGCSGPNHAQTYNPYLTSSASQQIQTPVGNAFANTAGYQQQQAGWGNSPLAIQALSTLAGRVDTDKDGIPDAQDPCPNDPLNKCTASNGTTPNTNSGDNNGNSATPTNTLVNFKVAIDKEPSWKKPCSDDLGEAAVSRTAKDTDGDGIPDACETDLQKQEHFIGLDPNVFNGAIVTAKRFYKENAGLLGAKKAADNTKSILLTSTENDAWKKSKDLGGFANGVDTKFDRQITKKFLARSTIGGNDMKGLGDLLAIQQPDKTGFNPNFEVLRDNKLENRGQNTDLMTSISKNLSSATILAGTAPTNSLQYALVRGNYYEMIPFQLNKDNGSVAYLSGMSSNTNSLRQDEEFLYVAETHVVIPEELNGGMDLRVGYLTNAATNAVAGSKSGMFFVIHDNNTDIVTTDLIQSNLSGTELQRSQGAIPNPANCVTAHLVIAYLADSNKLAQGISKAIFSENVFYHDKTDKDDSWKPIPQEWLRLKPMDLSSSQKCNVKPEEILFSQVSTSMSAATLPPEVDGSKTTSMNTPTLDQQIASIQGEIKDLAKSSTFDADKTKITGELDALDASGLTSDNDAKVHEMRNVLAGVTPTANTMALVGPKQ